MKYRIINRNREVYSVDESGAIGRPKLNLKPSGRWLARGLVRFNNFGHIVHTVPFSEWEQFIQSKPQWLYKNGRPRYYLADWDHGSDRICGSGVLGVDTVS